MTFWVGTIDGTTFVYDEDLQVSESKYLKLWSYSDNDVQSFDRDEARNCAQTVKDDAKIAKVQLAYKEWKESQFALYIAEEKQAAVNRKGFDLARKQMGRQNYCHKCANPLKANLTNVCGRCGWIRCNNCGACCCPRF